MALVTPRQLYDRLLAVTGAPSDEALARQLEEGLRTIQRLKIGRGVEFDRTIYLLGQAGWLNLDPQGPNLERARLLATQMADRLEQLAEALESSLSDGAQQRTGTEPGQESPHS